MSHVNVVINGRQYRMACEEGQEARLIALAESFESRIAGIRTRFGEAGDARLTVMAALTLADELLDAQEERRRLENEIAALHVARAGLTDRAARSEAAVVGALDAAAERIERMTLALSQPASGGMAIG